MGLLCNNRPVTLRKCREAACVHVFVYVFVRLGFCFVFFPTQHMFACVHAGTPEQPASASSTAGKRR